MYAKSLQFCPTLCNPVEYSLPGPSVHGILQAEYWSGLPCLPPGHILNTGIEPWSLISPALAGGFFTTSATWKAHIISHRYLWMSARLCLTLCDPMDCSPLGSSVHGILQARILQWVAISSSRGSSWPRDQTHISCVSCIGKWILYSLSHWGSPCNTVVPFKFVLT